MKPQSVSLVLPVIEQVDEFDSYQHGWIDCIDAIRKLNNLDEDKTLIATHNGVILDVFGWLAGPLPEEIEPDQSYYVEFYKLHKQTLDK